MDYELAKGLKDTGFPQERKGEYILPESYTYVVSNEEDEIKKLRCYIPTLLELIEACGKEFCSLEKCGFFTKSTPVNNEWACYDINKVSYGGETPEEAVSRLWLALNKKSHEMS